MIAAKTRAITVPVVPWPVSTPIETPANITTKTKPVNNKKVRRLFAAICSYTSELHLGYHAIGGVGFEELLGCEPTYTGKKESWKLLN
jgi:hypothetical protein